MFTQEHGAFPIILRMVKIGSTLYPVTHSFHVKDGADGDSWMNEFQSEALECDNVFSNEHPV